MSTYSTETDARQSDYAAAKERAESALLARTDLHKAMKEAEMAAEMDAAGLESFMESLKGSDDAAPGLALQTDAMAKREKQEEAGADELAEAAEEEGQEEEEQEEEGAEDDPEIEMPEMEAAEEEQETEAAEEEDEGSRRGGQGSRRRGTGGGGREGKAPRYLEETGLGPGG